MFDHPPFLAITTGITFVNFYLLLRRHVHFTQFRHRKVTQTILNFIYFASIISFGFITAKTLQSQIVYLFDEIIGQTTICKHRKLLSDQHNFINI